MTTTRIYGKLFPESRKCPSQNSSLLTNAINAVARTSWLCWYSMSRAHEHIPAQPIGDRASRTRHKKPRLRAERDMAVHFWLWGFLVSFFLFWSWACYSDAKVPKDGVIHGVPTRFLGTDGPRLYHRTCPIQSQSVPIQSSGLPHAL
jgi:hypothetical protein